MVCRRAVGIEIGALAAASGDRGLERSPPQTRRKPATLRVAGAYKVPWGPLDSWLDKRFSSALQTNAYGPRNR
jgi:hypothetical protein